MALNIQFTYWSKKEKILWCWGNFANAIEKRLDDDVNFELVLKDNKRNLEMAQKHKLNYILVENEYDFDIWFK